MLKHLTYPRLFEDRSQLALFMATAGTLQARAEDYACVIALEQVNANRQRLHTAFTLLRTYDPARLESFLHALDFDPRPELVLVRSDPIIQRWNEVKAHMKDMRETAEAVRPERAERVAAEMPEANSAR